MSQVRREENDVVSVSRKVCHSRRLSEDALASIPKDGIAKPFCRNEGDPSRAAFVKAKHANAQEGVVESLPAREDPLKISLGLDGLHEVGS